MRREIRDRRLEAKDRLVPDFAPAIDVGDEALVFDALLRWPESPGTGALG